MNILHMIAQTLTTSYSIFWEVLWSFILGFALFGMLQTVVSIKSIAQTLGDDMPRSINFATLFCIASSS